MNKALTLTIVIPVYNEEDHLKACLEAIEVQTVRPLEVIVVDNNSTDFSVHVAQQYAFVRVITAKRQGIAYARNAGFNAAKGKIIGRIDADTILPEDWVEKVLGFMESNPGTLLTGGSYMYDLGFPKFFGWVQETFAFGMNKVILGNYIAWGSNMAFPAHIWHEIKHQLHNDRNIHEDIDLGMHLIEAGYRIRYDKTLKVGIESRIFSERRRTRKQQLKYMMMWPATLYKHNLKRAWLGVIGAYLIYYLFSPIVYFHALNTAAKRIILPESD